MAKRMDFGEAAAVRMLARPELDPTRAAMIEAALLRRTRGNAVERMRYLRRVAERYRRLLAAKGA